MSSESVESPCIKWSSSSILWSCLRERDWWSVRLTDGLVRCLQWCNGVSSCCGEEGAELIYIPTLMRFGLWPKEQSHRCKWSKWVFFHRVAVEIKQGALSDVLGASLWSEAPAPLGPLWRVGGGVCGLASLGISAHIADPTTKPQISGKNEWMDEKVWDYA